MSMASTTTYLESSSMEASHPSLTIFSLVITSIVENSPLRVFACFSHTKSSTLRTSSYWEETTSAPRSIEYMDFTTNAREDTPLDFGKSFPTSSTACLSQHLSTKRSSACTEDFPLNSEISNRSRISWGRQTFQMQVYSVTCCGQILSAV